MCVYVVCLVCACCSKRRASTNTGDGFLHGANRFGDLVNCRIQNATVPRKQIEPISRAIKSLRLPRIQSFWAILSQPRQTYELVINKVAGAVWFIHCVKNKDIAHPLLRHGSHPRLKFFEASKTGEESVKLSHLSIYHRSYQNIIFIVIK